MWCKGKLNFLVFTFRANERRVEDSTQCDGFCRHCRSPLWLCLTVPDFKDFIIFIYFIQFAQFGLTIAEPDRILSDGAIRMVLYVSHEKRNGVVSG